MTPEEWLRLIPSVAKRVSTGYQWLVLRSGQSTDDIGAAEETLHSSLPAHLKQALFANESPSARSLLETLACLLNPAEDPGLLTPTGRSTEHLFPAFVHVLDAATEWAVFYDVDTPLQSFIGGIRPAQGPPDEWAGIWACHVPLGAKALLAWEQQAGVQLSPQMRQLNLLMGGALDDFTWPFVTGGEQLRRGDLYEGIYGLEEVQEQLQLPEELLHRLQDFVELKCTVVGDSLGFFASEPRRSEEYPIYEWLTHEQQFAPVAENFSEFLESLLTGRW